jgi:DNA-binding response OmpR family regulator
VTRVLVVEDERDLALGLRANLEVEGYDVVVASTGEDGIAAALSSAPDVIVLDLMLPGMDGYEVLASLRSRGIHAPVLILSARAEEVDKVRGFRTGADDYVTKPFGVMELLVRIQSLLSVARPSRSTHSPLRRRQRSLLDPDPLCGSVLSTSISIVASFDAMARRSHCRRKRSSCLRHSWRVGTKSSRVRISCATSGGTGRR